MADKDNKNSFPEPILPLAFISIFFLWKSYFYGILLIAYFYCQR